MRYFLALLVIVTLTACSHRDERREAEHDHKRDDQNSAAYKVGEAAHAAAKQAEKAAAAAAHALDENARKAREGWKQKEQEDKQKARDSR